MRGKQKTVGLTIASDFRFVELAEAVAQNLARLVGFDDDTIAWIGMAVREAVVNAIKHGNRQDESKLVQVRFSINTDTISVQVMDQGEGFDPTTVPNPLDPENLLKPTGRGIFYIRTFMDKVEFSSRPGGGTVVNMERRKSPSRGDEK